MNKITKHKGWLMGLSCFLVGVLAVIAVRFVTYKSNSVHYHANFALYINDQRDMFKSPLYYEEESACSADNKNDPKSRVHMHDQNPGLVHVHDNAVTWGQFLTNLGYTLGDTVLVTNSGTYIDGQDGNHLNFMLNGKPEISIANRVIGDRDRLLINYGNDSSATLQQRSTTVPTDAMKADSDVDPASCGGSSPKLSLGQRLKKAVLVGQN